ncbi:MAG TPA: twin-arginine translocase subunit TatB [Desulfonatronum sp.]|nr:twin-arginine translocase subunit TatB [Desulfonatronum sp.]
MFGIGTTELIIILLVALVILGPAKLPTIARSLGKALGEFRRVTTDVQRTLNLEAARIEEEEKHKTKPKQSPKAESKPEPADVPPPGSADSDPYAAQKAEKDSAPVDKAPPSQKTDQKSEEKA